jgi:uncharacterized repeat protein (TIGR01451 family)
MSALSFAQQPAGTIRGWGGNGSGQLGDGLSGDSNIPQSVQSLTDVVAVASGKSSGVGFSLAVKSDGSVWAWGNNAQGQLGTVINTLTSPVPLQVTGLGSGSGFIAVAAGDGHALALKSDGSVWAWGLNGNGQLGIGGSVGNPHTSPVPVQVSGLGSGSGVIAIAAGGSHSMALKSDGSVAAWGDNSFGQLGIGNQSITRGLSPEGVSGLGSGAGVIAIAAGFFHSMALKSDGSLLAWGSNHNGELGNGDNGFPKTDQFTPVAVTGFGAGSGVIAIAGGSHHSLALKSDGTEWAWGGNDFGQVGNGAVIGGQALPVTTPVQVSNLNGAVTIALGPSSDHALAIVQPVAALSATSLSFGDQLVGTPSAPQMITIQNTGQDPLKFNGFSVSGAAAADFKVSAPSTPFTVSPGSSTTVNVAFNPTVEFARLATLHIDDDGFQAPQFVALSGNGLVQADIAVGLGASPTPVHDKKDLSYTISVKNGGPTSAPAVVMNDVLPAGTVFVSGKTTQGNCLAPAPGTTGTVTCNLGTLNSGAAATITLVVAVQAPGGSTLVNMVSATAGATDPNLANNSVTVATPVLGPKH